MKATAGYRWTAANAGCLLADHHGWHNDYRMVDLAVASGWPMSADDAAQVNQFRQDAVMTDFIYEITAEAEAWMNRHAAPDGFSFGWHEGSFYLQSDQWWREAF